MKGRKKSLKKSGAPRENTRVEDDYPSPEPITPLLLGLRRKKKTAEASLRAPLLLLPFSSASLAQFLALALIVRRFHYAIPHISRSLLSSSLLSDVDFGSSSCAKS